MRGGVEHFALSIMTAPDLEAQRFCHQRLCVESGPADKAIAWYIVGRVFAEACRAMHPG